MYSYARPFADPARCPRASLQPTLHHTLDYTEDSAQAPHALAHIAPPPSWESPYSSSSTSSSRPSIAPRSTLRPYEPYDERSVGRRLRDAGTYAMGGGSDGWVLE
ncbi:hypothetical protein D9611_006164 [Ephemerocybe angulata]|uniref:Uncharacterized protein n=1 Tax=Ephemerocybe angulata TaxID=980116 RepID=A0A8H5FLI7_9AGAR|nr:hypothetical protein D9611_006164 [Tulosesus angulatus]